MPTLAITGLAPATGKTTTAVHLAEQLGALGARVLLVDLSPDADASEAIRGVRTVHLRRALEADLPLETCLAPTRLPGVDLLTLPAGPLTGSFPGHSADGLAGLLRRAAPDYAYVLIDLPPEEGVAADVGLAIADAALVPAPLERESLDDVPKTMELIGKARAGTNPSLRALLLFTVATATDEARRVAATLRDSYPNLILRTRIPADGSLNTLLDGTRHGGVPSAGINAYHQLAGELASRLVDLRRAG